jgi:Tol biopolymer transport system component
MRLCVRDLLVSGVVVGVVGVGSPAFAATQLVSLGASDNLGNGISGHAGLGAGRTYVVFSSTARNLVAGDTNGAEDCFYRNLSTGAFELLSVSSSGARGNAKSLKPVPSSDGTVITFQSEASNLVSGDTNGRLDVFVRNRSNDTTRRVSVSSSGGQGNGDSTYPQISPNGRYVVFASVASNLAGSDGNGLSDIFRHDLQTGRTEHVSVSTSGGAANGNSLYPAISGDGRYIAFQSNASNLVPGDTNRQNDVFVRDMETGRTERVSVSSSGAQAAGGSGYPDLSDDGRYVIFLSRARNLSTGDTNSFDDLFVHDRTTDTTTRLTRGLGNSQINGHTISPEISGNGQVIVFGSEASNLVAGDTNGVADVFTVNRLTGTIRRMSVGNGGQQGSQRSFQQHIAQDGSSVVYSTRSNLVGNDTNGAQDVYLSN